MKRVLFLLVVFLLGQLFVYSQDNFDPNVKPEPLNEKEFKFPDYSETRLANGLKIFVVEDNEQPTINLSLLIPGGTSQDGNLPGLANIVASLLTKGAGKRTALDIAKTLDGLGASINVSATPDYITISVFSLKRHFPTVFEIFKDCLLQPTFPESEFNKLIPKLIAGIKQEKAQPSRLAQALARRVVFGEDHPYGKKETEESIKSIKLSDVRDYYKKYFVPDFASLVITGDVKKREIISTIEKDLLSWSKANSERIKLPGINPMPLGIYFVERPGSVQSTIIITTRTVDYLDFEYETLDMAAALIGGGFGGRLSRTLRETYSYTYSPYASQTSLKFMNRFFCGADVRNSVTDSALAVMLEQMTLLATQPPTEEEVNRILRAQVGKYLMNFESSNFIAGLIQNADFHGKAMASVKSYPQRMLALSNYDLHRSAERYMNPKNAFIIVVGAPEVKEKLNKFGKVFVYNLDLEPLTGEKAKLEKVSITPNELIEKYIKAIGGSNAINNIKTLTKTGKASLAVQGRNIPVEIVENYKVPNKKFQTADFGMYSQKIWVDGENAWSSVQGPAELQQGPEAKKLLIDAVLFNDIKLSSLGYNLKVLGKQGNEILMKAEMNDNESLNRTYYFDANTFLINKIEGFEVVGKGQPPLPVTITFSDYSNFGGVLLPKKVESSNPMFNMEINYNFEINPNLEDSLFSPPKTGEKN
ncbi:MAG: insulinase family protein [Candidatus Kapabacteria bacterium]|nr:insulinase family protein [Candidatus Kapabacteria bacterium]